MPKVKHRKDHKKKVNARNERIKKEKEKYQKSQKDFLMKLIEEEQKKGMFNNLQQIPSVSNPSIDEHLLDGPSV